MSKPIEKREAATKAFFNEMASTYDADVQVLGWDPVEVVKLWPFMVFPGESYLDVGCGTGALLSFFSGAQRKLSAMDLSTEMIAQARRREDLKQVDFVQGSAEAIWPFPTDEFDKVTCLAMLEFVEHLDVALDELLRVMKPGGRALFSVEDRIDWLDTDRGGYELRYGEFPLWRRSLEEVKLYLPPGAKIVKSERQRGYEVTELGFTTAYHVIEIEKEYT